MAKDKSMLRTEHTSEASRQSHPITDNHMMAIADAPQIRDTPNGRSIAALFALQKLLTQHRRCMAMKGAPRGRFCCICLKEAADVARPLNGGAEGVLHWFQGAADVFYFTAMAAGSRIVVHPGVYPESLSLTVEVELVAAEECCEEAPAEIIGQDAPSLRATGAAGRIHGLCFSQLAADTAASEDTPTALLVDGCRLLLQECVFSGAGSTRPAVVISGRGTAPTLVSCVVREARIGVLVRERARGELRMCDVHHNRVGMVLAGGGDPTLIRSKLHRSKESGVLACKGALGRFEACRIYGNGGHGLDIQSEANPTVEGNKLSGVLVCDHGLGTLERCVIRRNRFRGLAVRSGGQVALKQCEISDNGQSGVVVYNAGGGVLEDCVIQENELNGLVVKAGGNPTLRHCRMLRNEECGVLVCAGGLGVLQDCLSISCNGLAGVAVERQGNPSICRSKIHGNSRSGVLVCDEGVNTAGEGIFEECKIYGNTLHGLDVANKSQPTVITEGLPNCPQIVHIAELIAGVTVCDISWGDTVGLRISGCKMQDNEHSGLVACDGAAGEYSGCEMRGNQGCGVELFGGAGGHLREAMVNGNGGCGVLLGEGCSGSITICTGGDVGGLWDGGAQESVFEANAGHGVSISSGAEPTLSGVTCRGNLGNGIILSDRGKGLLEECCCSNNGGHGLEIATSACPTIRRCSLQENRGCGVLVGDCGEVVFEECSDIQANDLHGMVVMAGGAPEVRRCSLHSNKQNGLLVQAGGKGQFRECKLQRNGSHGVDVVGSGAENAAGGAGPCLETCHLEENGQCGLLVRESAVVELSNCTVASNRFHGVAVTSGGQPRLHVVRVTANLQNGVLIYEGGRGHFEQCCIAYNELNGVVVSQSSGPTITLSQIQHNGHHGVLMSEDGGGLLEDGCSISGNALHGVAVNGGKGLVARGATVSGNGRSGIAVEGGGGAFSDCDVHRNGEHGAEIRGASQPEFSCCKLHANRGHEMGAGYRVPFAPKFPPMAIALGLLNFVARDPRKGGVHERGVASRADQAADEGGAGTLEHCALHSNECHGVVVKADGDPNLLSCHVHGNQRSGVVVSEAGCGVLLDCVVEGNAGRGLDVSQGGSPSVRRTEIQRNALCGVIVRQQGEGVFEDCRVAHNKHRGVELIQQMSAVRASVQPPAFRSSYAAEGGGNFEDCDLHTNELSGFAVKTDAHPEVAGSRIHSNNESGVFVYDEGRGVFHGCQMYANKFSGVAIKTRGAPVVESCHLHSNL
eukprot:gene1902-2586_t